MDGKSKVFLEVDQDLRRIGESEKSTYLPPCPHGKKCYRKNLQHFREYRHSNNMVSIPEKMTRSSTNRGTQQQQKKTPQKGSLSITTKSKSITSYFKPRTSTADSSLEASTSKDKREKGGEEKNASQAHCSNESTRDNCELEYSDESDGVEFPKFTAARATKRKFKGGHHNGTRSSVKSRKSRKNSSDDDSDNDLKKLLPDLGQILAQPDHFKSTTPLGIPSSSSEPSSQSSLSKTSKVLNSAEWNNLIEQIFLVKMPNDFFKFWDFCKQVSPRSPQNALLNVLGFKLVGPFDVLTGTVDERNIDEDKDTILTHWRFFYDPPEMQTFAVIDESNLLSFDSTTSYHLGYFRDTPEATSPVVVSNDAEKSCVITGVADNIFAAIYSELLKRKATANKSSNNSLMGRVKHFESQLKTFASLHKIEINANQQLKNRKKKSNALTFHKFGIVVDVVNDIGYRELPETDANLKKIFDRITSLENDEQRRKCASMSQIHDIMTWINYANDEKDFGMGLEFGIDLFATGHPFFHRSSKHLLTLAYNLLERDAFGRIITAHIDNRKLGSKLDVTKD